MTSIKGAFSSRALPQIVLFGDSLTAYSFDDQTRGFGWYLERMYKDKAEIDNQGFAGYTTSSIKRDFDRLIERITQPDAAPTLFITIFLGANDACFVGKSEYVPLPLFEDNIRSFISTILSKDELSHTKIVLITPPPINVPDPEDEPYDEDEDLGMGPLMQAALARARPEPKEERAYRTYMSKKRYADAIMRISKAFDAERVVGLDYWKALVDAGLKDQGRSGGDEDAYDEDKLPGCGLHTAKQFREGYFTDGLHLGVLGYQVLNESLMDVVLGKWPELATRA
ncbi:SGNH hydrolase [Periconia macrospinosa]|uniref:SGNH hydrolase n=1 Tax=Periconia macrospinosa TaxID=97972 RepID=A0A2V1DD48_9PLEO|nr:SGNH hydrolase [Periconia macrospinosa]